MSRWELIHKAELDKADTSLRFTDVLFGFVIKELFTRLSDWRILSGATRAHLVAGGVLVLGSYIGFRNSLQRQNWKLMFFNLPLLRFILDQAMVALYFRLATLTPFPAAAGAPLQDAELVRADLRLLMLIFALYVAWDVVSYWMYKTKYSRKDQRGSTIPYDEARLIISLAVLLIFAVMGLAGACHNLAESHPIGIEVAGVGFLVAYRVLKDARI